MSNSDTKLIEESFITESYNIHKILCRRNINSKNPESTVYEVLVRNCNDI